MSLSFGFRHIQRCTTSPRIRSRAESLWNVGCWLDAKGGHKLCRHFLFQRVAPMTESMRPDFFAYKKVLGDL